MAPFAGLPICVSRADLSVTFELDILVRIVAGGTDSRPNACTDRPNVDGGLRAPSMGTYASRACCAASHQVLEAPDTCLARGGVVASGT